MTKDAHACLRWGALSVLAGLVLASGCSRRSGVGENNASATVDTLHCGEDSTPVGRTDSTLTDGETCGLVTAGITAFRTLAPAPFGAESDTVHVSEARIISQTFRDWNTDSLVGDWWVVTLELPGQQWNVDVRIDRVTGATEAQAVHKPIGR
jgi:hypothetical protein